MLISLFIPRKWDCLPLAGIIKRIDDFFYSTPTLLKNIVDFVPDSSIINEFPIETYPALLNSPTNFYVNSPYTAYVKGLEIEWQSNFTWLRAPFNGIVLNANYTHVWSETKYMEHRIRYDAASRLLYL